MERQTLPEILFCALDANMQLLTNYIPSSPQIELKLEINVFNLKVKMMLITRSFWVEIIFELRMTRVRFSVKRTAI